MIVCADCGRRNEERADFCGACGAYLDWDGQHGDTAADTVRTGGGAAPTAAADPIAAMQPAPAAARPVPTSGPKDDAPPAPDEIRCRPCGASNKPDRMFCRRCGQTLHPEQASVPARRRWFSRRSRSPAAGERPRSRARRRRAPLVLLVLAAMVAAVAVARRDALREFSESAQDRIRGTQRMSPSAVTASSAHPNHRAALISDGTTDKYWAPTAAGDGGGQHLLLTFEQPFRLVYLRIFNGADVNLQRYLAQGRPKELRVTVTRSRGEPVTRTVALRDEPGPQEIHIVVPDTTAVRVAILSATGIGSGRRPALAEIEFLGRR